MVKEELLDLLRSGDGASYIRVSTDQQDTQRQREGIDRWLLTNGLTVKPQFRFEDEGFVRDLPQLRPDFQRMMTLADRRLIRWIVADRQDRFGTKDKFQFIAFMHRLREAKCPFVTIDGKCWTSDEMMTFIEGGMGAEASRKEQREKSYRVLSVKITRARRGEWQGGHLAFGMDVACHGPDDVERWRVRIEGRTLTGTKVGKGGKPKRIYSIRRVKVYPDGTEEVFEGSGTFPATEYNEVLRQTPSKDAARIAAVQEVFGKFSSEATNYSVLADHLNRLGVRNYYADRWEHYHVRDMLDNPIYVGFQRWNGHGQGRFHEFVGGEQRAVTEASGRRERDKADWVLSDRQLFDPVIPPEVFETVQRKLEANPAEKRAPKSPDLWLSDLVFCAGCGKEMRGQQRPNRCEYFCSTYAKQGTASGCLRNAVAQDEIEERLREYLAEAAPELRTMMTARQTGNLDLLKPFEEKHAGVVRRCWESVDRIVRTLHRYPVAKQMMSSHLDALLTEPERETGGKAIADDYFLDFVEPLRAIYDVIFEKEEPILRERLAELDAEHTLLTDRVLAFDPVSERRALEKAKAQIAAVEEEMTALEARLVNQSEEFVRRFADLRQMSFAFDDAAAALDDPATEARRKAEAVRGVVERINVSFRPTGKKSPMSEVVGFEFVPVGPGSRAMYPNRASN